MNSSGWRIAPSLHEWLVGTANRRAHIRARGFSSVCGKCFAMAGVMALRTNVAHWSSPFCRQLDRHFTESGVALIDLPWDFELLQNDQDHFTARGFDSFRRALAAALSARGVEGDVFVIADSTVDHINRSDPTRPADEKLRRSLATHGMNATVASQSGSGFCALQEHRRSFLHLARHQTRAKPSLKNARWVLVGGWNDDAQQYPLNEVKQAIAELLAMRG